MAEPTYGDPNYGIQDTLTVGSVTYILQGTNPNDQEETFDWQNQLGQNIGSKHIQLASTGSISAIGPAGTAVSGQSVLFPLAVGSKLLFRGLHWQINGIAEAGVYNDATVWTLTVRRWTLFPVAASVLPDVTYSASAALPITVSPDPPAG